MHERSFVLKPLLEISPELAKRFKACPGQKIERIG